MKEVSDDTATIRLCGRETETTQLESIWRRVCSGGSHAEAVFVNGESGAGKTCFCRQLESLVLEDRGVTNDTTDDSDCIEHRPQSDAATTPTDHYFISGKLDQYAVSREPFVAIVQALNELGAVVTERGSEQTKVDLVAALQDAVILQRLVPSFMKLVENPIDSASEGESLVAGSERLTVALRAFLKAFCRQHTVTMFIDDLQWAHPAALELITDILKDRQLSNFLLVTAYRTPTLELDGSSRSTLSSSTFLLPATKLPSMITNLRAANVSVTEMTLANLELTSIREMVCDMLLIKAPSSDIEKLVQISWRRCQGNPNFTRQFISMLQRQGLLRYTSNFVWEWNHQPNDERLAPTAFETLVEMLTQRVVQLPQPVRKLLQMASCMGFVFEISILHELFNKESTIPSSTTASGESTCEATSFWGALKRAEQEGLIEVTMEDSSAKFCHDKIQQAVYEMIPPGILRQGLHQTIGQHIYETMMDSADKYVFMATDQLNRSKGFNKNDQSRLDLIRLNLRASNLARQKAAVVLVAGYLAKAIALIRSSEDWVSHYDLVLEIYTLSCESEFSRGQFVASRQRMRQVELHARNLRDRIRVLVIKIQIFGALREFSDAIKETRRVLALLGEKMPPSMTIHVIREFLKAQKLAKGHGDEYFLSLRPMTDWAKRTAMRILKVASVYAWNRGDKAFAGLCFLRLFNVTLQHGFCEETSYGYAAYGMMLAATKNEDEGVRFARLANQAVSTRLPCPATAVAVYVFLWHLKHPVALGLEPLLNCYRSGLELGDMEFGAISYSAYVDLYMFCGLPLGPFESDTRNFGEQLRLCHQDLPLSFILPYYRLACNLCGKTKEPELVTWDSCREFTLFSENMTRYNDSRADMNMCHAQLLNAYLLRNQEIQIKCLEQIRKLNNFELDGTHFSTYFYALCIGLSASTLYRDCKKVSYWFLARRMKNWLKQVSARRNLDCVGIIALLEAESMRARPLWCGRSSPHALIREKYDQAISLLARSGMTHFCAIACEQAGRFLQGDQYWSEVYIRRSVRLFEEWGAVVKVKALEAEFAFIEPSKLSRDDWAVLSVRGRKRFDVASHSFNFLPDSFETEN